LPLLHLNLNVTAKSSTFIIPPCKNYAAPIVAAARLYELLKNNWPAAEEPVAAGGGIKANNAMNRSAAGSKELCRIYNRKNTITLPK
jgi:hypothetical protein